MCGGETATQRLRALYVAVPTCGHNGCKGCAQVMTMVVVKIVVVVVVDYTVHSRVYVHPRQTDGAAEEGGKYT